MSAPVIFAEVEAGQRKLGRVTLNVEATLNSLTLEMVDIVGDFDNRCVVNGVVDFLDIATTVSAFLSEPDECFAICP